jgi:hypothetical protein
VAGRQVAEHGEGDLIVGKDSRPTIGTLVDRTTRHVKPLYPPDGRDALVHAIRPAADFARSLTLTWAMSSAGDFDTSNGPDLRVWLIGAQVKEGSECRRVLDDARYVSLGKLKGDKGSQNYTVSRGCARRGVRVARSSTNIIRNCGTPSAQRPRPSAAAARGLGGTIHLVLGRVGGASSSQGRTAPPDAAGVVAELRGGAGGASGECAGSGRNRCGPRTHCPRPASGGPQSVLRGVRPRPTEVLASADLALNGEVGRGRHVRRGGGTAGCR